MAKQQDKLGSSTTWVPLDVGVRHHLPTMSGAEAKVYLALRTRYNTKTGQLNPSLSTLAIDSGLTLTGVKKAGKALRKKDLISSERTGTSNCWNIHRLRVNGAVVDRDSPESGPSSRLSDSRKSGPSDGPISGPQTISIEQQPVNCSAALRDVGADAPGSPTARPGAEEVEGTDTTQTAAQNPGESTQTAPTEDSAHGDDLPGWTAKRENEYREIVRWLRFGKAASATPTPLPRDWMIVESNDLLEIDAEAATPEQLAAWAWAMLQFCRLQHPTMALSTPKSEQIQPGHSKCVLGDLIDTHGAAEAAELIYTAAEHHRKIQTDAAQHEPPQFHPRLDAGFFKSRAVVSRALQILERKKNEALFGPDLIGDMLRRYAA